MPNLCSEQKIFPVYLCFTQSCHLYIHNQLILISVMKWAVRPETILAPLCVLYSRYISCIKQNQY